MSIWRVHIATWVPKATDTHSEYVTLIAFPLQQWLHERASVLHYFSLLFALVILPSLYQVQQQTNRAK
jgi:hypothetical protein